MDTPSTISEVYTRTVSPINSVGRTLGRVAWNIVNTTPDKQKALRFISSLGLLFNLRVRPRVVPERGFYTFFIALPKPECFYPDRPASRGESNYTSFRLSQEMLGAGVQTLPEVYMSLDRFSWNQLRNMIPSLPATPLNLSVFHDVLGNFNRSMMTQEGTPLNGLIKAAAEIRKKLDTVVQKEDTTDLI